jgi:addiction module RelB/DinJ family antitoxin
MNNAVINIKVDPKVKAEAQKTAEELGFSLSSLINAYLKNLIRTKKVTFKLPEEERELSEYAKKTIAQSEVDIKNGKLIMFEKVDDSLSYLGKIVEDNEKNKQD